METFSALLALCAGNSAVNSPHIGQWPGSLMFLWSAPWIDGWVNNREAGDLIRHRAHYDATVMTLPLPTDGPDARPSAHTIPTEKLDIFSFKSLSIKLPFIDSVTLYGPDDVIQHSYTNHAKSRRTNIWLFFPFLVDCICDQHMMHDDVIHRSPVNSSHKGQWRGALMFSLICAWINGWVNNREAGDLRRHRAHYDVIVLGHANQDIRAVSYTS